MASDLGLLCRDDQETCVNGNIDSCIKRETKVGVVVR